MSRKDSKGRKLYDGESQRKDNGLYMYRWTDSKGKRHQITSMDLKTLRDKEAELEKSKAKGLRVEDKNTTVNDIYDMWKSNKVGLKSTTKGNYYYSYEHYIRNDFGTRKIQTLRKSDILKLYNDLSSGENGLKMATIENIHTVLHQVFQTATDDDYILRNITEGVLGECKRARNYQRPKRHALTIPEQKAFMGYVKDVPKFNHWAPLFTFFLGTGCRVGEITGLTWNDIDFDNEIISINHSLVYYDREANKTYHHITTPKTKAGVRFIPMLPDVKNALLDEKNYQQEAGITCKARIDGYTNFVFLNRFGDVHNPQTINRTIKRIIEAYNNEESEKAIDEEREPLIIPNFSCHNLRHTFATRYCENETNLKVIQSILGHKDIATTMDVYAEATQDKIKQSFTNLSGKITIA